MDKTSAKHKLETLFAEAADPHQYVEQVLHRMVELLQGLDSEKLGEFIGVLDQAVERKNRIFLIGNGGASAVTSHLVNDLSIPTYVEGAPKFQVLSLADNVPSITAIANDMGYEHIFLRQLQQHLAPQDVVVAFSVSGNSPNIVKAIEYANANQAISVGICGFDGGWLGKNSELTIHIPTTRDEYGPVEDIFGCIGHIVSSYLILKRDRRLCH